MEGNERRAVEARIQCLRNIQTLLDAAVVQLQQYTSILTTLSSSPQFREAFATPAATVPNDTATAAASAAVHFDVGSNEIEENANHGSNSASVSRETSEDGASTSRGGPSDDVRSRRLNYFGKNKEGNTNNGN